MFSSSTKPRSRTSSTPTQLKSVYYPEVEQLIKHESGAARVVIFDHTLRSGDETEREAKLIREPVLSAHNDYTEWSGPNRVREILPDEAEALLAHRFAIIQVWRAINQPIQANPLALADAKSVAMEDLIVAERRYPHRVGQTYRLKYNPNHRWFYFPEMRRDEAWCSRFTIRKRTAGRALRRTRRSRIPPRRQTRRRGRASRCALSRSSGPDLKTWLRVSSFGFRTGSYLPKSPSRSSRSTKEESINDARFTFFALGLDSAMTSTRIFIALGSAYGFFSNISR